jgi:hypothetical protein
MSRPPPAITVRFARLQICCSKTTPQCGSHNPPINIKGFQPPTLGLDGLLRVVEVVARIRANQALTEQEGALYLSQLSPPARRFNSPTFVADPASVQKHSAGALNES